MEYDVTGTLKIDTEAFEKALKDAQKRIDNFKKDLESLGNIAKEMGFPELNKSLKDINKQLDNVEADFGEIDKSADNVTESVKKLKKETKGAKDNIKTLDEYFDQASTSAKKLTAETKKAKVDTLANDVKKVGTSFTEMDKTVSSSMTNLNNRIDEVDARLKKSYSSLNKYYEEFNALNSRMMKNEKKLGQIYSHNAPRHWLPNSRYKQNLREPQMGYNYWELERTSSNRHWRHVGGDRRDYPAYRNAYLEDKDIKEGLAINKRTLEEELKYINELERELAELKQQKESLMSSSTGADKLVYELEAPIRKIRELKREMNTLFKKNISEYKKIPKTFKDVSLENGFLADEKESEKMKARFKEMFEEMNVARNKIKETLNKLVNDYGMSMKEISSLTGGLFDPKILTEGLSEAVVGIKPTLKDLEKQIMDTKRKISKIQEDAMKKSKKLTQKAIDSNRWSSPDFLPRRKDGSYYNNSRVKRELEYMQDDQRYAENYKLEEFLKLQAELESLEREFETLSKEKNKFFNENSYTTSGLKNNIELIKSDLKRAKIDLRSAVRDVRYDRGQASEYEGNSYWHESYMKDVEKGMKKVKALRDTYRSIKTELQGLESQYDILKNKQNSAWRVEQLEPLIQMMTKVATSTDRTVESVREMDSEMSNLSFDDKLKVQFDGLNQMLVETGQMSVEQARMFGTEIIHSLDNVGKKANEITKNIRGRMNIFYKNFGGKSGKWFTEQSPYGQASTRWIHEQLSTTRDFFKGFTQGFAKLKKEQSESVTWMNELHVKMNELKYSSRDFINTQAFKEAKAGAEEYIRTLDKVKARMNLTNKYKPQFNQYSAGFLGDANIQKDIQLVNEFHRVTREVSASTNQWVNQEITDFNRFSQAVQKSITKAREEMQLLNTSFRKAGNMTGVGFAGTNQFQQINRSMQEYNRLSNLANLNTNRMGLGFEKFGQYTQKAESNVRSFGGVLRSLRTTMSMIGGMFVWEFAFKIMDSARATISAKSEMESYYKTLHMGSKEIANFNKSLDNTISTYQKMNKFQLGETIASLGVEFKMSTDEMNQVMKVAPMIVNEYLRAGRSTEEAILAIKDISQGEFLRLSRETGVGAKEIKEAGWSGDNKDIISLYQALEKIGTARHWDVFASKAQSLNDVMLITENRMTEFVTLLSDAVTPVIVTSFNALGDAFNSASRWYEGLGSYDKAIVQITTLGTVGLTTAGVFNSHLVPAVKNVGTNLISSFLGVDSAIAKEKGLAQAIAHETAVERIANIERKGGQKVLHAKIMTLKAEELANSLGMNTTKLRMRYENLQQMAMKRGTTELKARELAQRSLILAEEQNITTTQAMNILLEEEALAEMGTAKALLVRKLGLDANIVSEEGMIVAMNEKIAESFPYISSLVSETLATLGLESATASLVVTLGLLVAPLIAIGVAVAPLIASFLDLQKSYETLSDTFENGQQRIDELEQKQKGYQKTIDELGNKTNLTAEEEAKLQEARDGLTYTTDALEDATNRYNKSVEYTHIVNKNIEKVEGERAKNLKEINKELEKQTGKKYTIDSSYGMTTAYKEQYRTLQVIAWEEEHRPERFKKLSESIKNTSKDQEEYNKKIQEFGNDWNQAYSDMEDAQLKRIDPNSDAFTRLWSYFDESWAIAKMDWIEFWADPFASISGELGFDGLSQSFNDALTQMGQDWDNFWQPITDFFNNFSVGSDFDPFAGLKDWWGDANTWLDSIMPDISVDSFKQWFGKNIREPFQKAWNEFWANPFGGGEDKKGGQGGTPTASKTFNLSGMFKFNFGGLKDMFNNGFRKALGGIPNIISTAGQLWSKLGLGNGQKTVTSIKQGLHNLKGSVEQKFHEGANTIKNIGKTWGTNAHNTAKGVYDKIKSGIGDPARKVKEKLNEVTTAIKNIKAKWSKAIKDAVSVFNVNIPSLNGGWFGAYGYRRSASKPRNSRVRLNAPVYGGSSVGFETVLRTMLTNQGFRSPSSYQFYPNSQKTTQETWDSGKANCFDGASLIVALGQMFGLKGRIITGNWNGTGHAGAIVGGKLYDMTQFQRRGVFRGTQGVHFGSKGNGSYKGASTEETKKEINIHITNDLSNARIYGIDDLDNHIKQTTERTFYELNSTDGAIGY